MTTKTIDLKKIIQEKPVITKFEEKTIKSSLFYDYYLNTLRAIENYLVVVDEEERVRNKPILKEIESDNNIFALLGDRGVGKTSCMNSVANFLVSEENCKNINNIFKNEKFEKIPNVLFNHIDTIDPSYFDDKHNIISLVISQMYREFTEKNKNPEIECSRKGIKDCLLKDFSKVSENLDVLLSNSDRDDTSIEKLVNLSGAVDLKTNFHNLVQNWLLFIYGSYENRKLLILIDDIDLNTEYGDEMLEQIRKYLIQDNVIVLMSLNIKQMELVKEKNIYDSFSSIVGKQRTDESIKEMAISYLTKVIPYEHRIFINDLKSELGTYVDGVKILENSFDKKSGRNACLYDYIPMLIYEKTKYYFYSTKEKPSEIIPYNLRLLKQLANTFIPLKATNRNNDQKYNKEWFKHYFFDNWCKENLDYNDYENILSVILNVRSVIDINKTVVRVLVERFSFLFNFDETRDGKNEENIIKEQEIKYIIDQRNLNANISFGDVYSIIRYIEDRLLSYQDKRLLFSIKTFYSIKLYELNKQDEEKVNEEKETTEFEQIIGGSYINTVCQNILVSSQNNVPYRANRYISCKNLTRLIESCVNEENKNTEEYRMKLKLAEFFMLCTSRPYDTKNSQKNTYTNPEYRRTISQPYYNYEFTAQREYIFFDLGAFFFNLVRPKKCYQRFVNNKEFIKLVEEEKSSFYNWRVRQDYQAIFYTFDSIDLFVRRLEKNYDRSNVKDDPINLLTFFKTVSEFTVGLYPDKITDVKTTYPLSLSNFFIELKMDEMFKKLPLKEFGEIYNYWQKKEK